jgi:hypothetical protein
MTEKHEPKFRRGCLGDVVNYFVEHRGDLVTLEQLEKALRSKWDRRQILHAMSPSTVSAGNNGVAKRIVRHQFGVWSLDFDSKAEPKAAQPAADKKPVPVVDKFSEPEQPDNGVMVKARNGILYVDGVPADLEVFVMGLRIAVKVS